MKKNYESPKTEYIELDTQNVLMASPISGHNVDKDKDSVTTPIANEWD